MSIEQFKKHFDFTSGFIHFNNSGQAPIPDVNRDKVKYWLDRFYSEGAHCSMDGWGQTEVVRQKLANFIGAEVAEVAFFGTAASAISQAALAIPLQKDDEILTWDQEYPSNFYPWRIAAERSQAKVIQLASENWQTPAQKILDHVTPKTRVIAVSWVQFQTGAVTDLELISKTLRAQGRDDIWLVADVIQGIGVRPFHFHQSGFDIICGGSHKWLCSSYGASFMAIRHQRMPQLAPLEFGAMTYGYPDTEKSFSIQPKLTAQRYEPGSKAMFEVIGLGETLDLMSQVGVAAIFQEASRLADLLRAGLRSQGYKMFCADGPIVNFAADTTEKTEELLQRLQKNKVSCIKRGPGIRISIHGFNRDEEVARVLEILKY
ncbi:aminotransferase class V-fold PLP-dependent enzyme [Pseudobdellovibrio exovorus]|uniref:Aminotransferase class V domain-containing protein n=1 Tax=Pseudobdellovibrio exovorus JSS TaxID=1184267 RepID=M4VBR5_9BACT|nr:aminotransferase class V-fold PLP-dependent enzyme [Pseudobdellovibrio exovorus]AGH96668.1 hypothetical protein A11Q_2452 [Pseudobdellovibrio exovorus JSS]